jgi:hypothetical protein
MLPLLPIPVTTSLPLQRSIARATCSKGVSIDFASCSNAFPSNSSVRLAEESMGDCLAAMVERWQRCIEQLKDLQEKSAPNLDFRQTTDCKQIVESVVLE